MIKFITLLFFILANASMADSRVKRVPVTGDQIITVNTAIGIATIIQVPDRPNSVVVGDQDAFKVEYLDQAITIKPLFKGSKSNLYVYTDWKRFNVQLVSGAEASADYVVYLENPRPEEKISKKVSSVVWTPFKNHLNNENITLEVNRLGKAKDGVLLIEFSMKSKIREEVKPEWIWITQENQTRPIQSLFLSAIETGPKNVVSGVIQLQQDDFNTNVPIKFELKRKKVSFLTITRIGAWK